MPSERLAPFAVLVILMFAIAGPVAARARPQDDPPQAEGAQKGEGATPAVRVVPADEEAAESAGSDAPVGPEDLLEISVFEIPDLTRTVRVSEKGAISLPLLGEILVAGMTPTSLEGKLRELLASKYLEDPQVSVFVREHGSKKVSVLGAVGKPGVYEMLGTRTLLQVLSEAGGLAKEVGSDLYILRTKPGGGRDRMSVDVAALLAGQDPSLNVIIQPGDIVTVPVDRLIFVYVDGAVKTPGRLEEVASRPITLGQAIAKAGGATERANLKAIQVLRKGKDGERITLTANLTRIRKGKEPDHVLQDGDVVVIPETFF
jgi:polysaccharide biosynthesis/export protein